MAKIGQGYQLGLGWSSLVDGKVPEGAIETQPGVYVARAKYNGEIIPGKYASKYNLCYIPFGGEEVMLQECQILCDTSCTNCGDW